MRKNEELLLKMVAKWKYHNKKLQEINKFLFEHTELYEQQYTSDFYDDLFRFFAGKITRFARDNNELMKKLTEKQAKRLREIEIMEN